MVYFYLTTRMLWRWIVAIHLPASVCSFTQWAFLHSARNLIPTLCCTDALTAGSEVNQDAREVGAWSSLLPKENVTIAVFYPGHSRKKEHFVSTTPSAMVPWSSSFHQSDEMTVGLLQIFKIRPYWGTYEWWLVVHCFHIMRKLCSSIKLTWTLRTDYQI